MFICDKEVIKAIHKEYNDRARTSNCTYPVIKALHSKVDYTNTDIANSTNKAFMDALDTAYRVFGEVCEDFYHSHEEDITDLFGNYKVYVSLSRQSLSHQIGALSLNLSPKNDKNL